MISYTVVDVGSDGQSFAVRDAHGRLHVARATGPCPDIDDALLGQEAALGVHLLVGSPSHLPVRVDFAAVGCTQGDALTLLHPLAAALHDH
jgi:hypothetical protein